MAEERAAAYRGRTGWSEEEIALLKDELKRAAFERRTLRSVFEEMAKATGRMPNSIRNYYYTQVRALKKDDARRQAFQSFTREESLELLKIFLREYAKGKSIRACAMELSAGDKRLMLRYQNKYRSLVRSNSALVREAQDALAAQGITGRAAMVGRDNRSENAAQEKLGDFIRSQLALALDDLQEKQTEQVRFYREKAEELADLAGEYLKKPEMELLDRLSVCIASVKGE